MELPTQSSLPRRDFLRVSATIGGLAVCHQAVPFLRAAQSQVLEKGILHAGISVDVETVLHHIDSKIYGTFVEHLGRAVYDGIYQEGSPLSDEQGFRRDVLEAARDWGVPVLRWPGGDFASGYHWMDGIGPKHERPRRYNAAWFEEESNHFGTHEFIDYCRKLRAEPYICVNLGTGTSEEAANWVEYCNGTTDTYYANLRRKNGAEKPFNVKYWALGNEVYGEWQIGHKTAEDYSKLALETGKMMKWVDPEIRLVACGFDAEWNSTVLERLVHIADYISLHDYEGAPDYYEMLGSIKLVEDKIRQTDALIEVTDALRSAGDPILAMSLPKKKDRIEIAVDEWNVWSRKHDIWRRDVPNPLEETYNLRDALWIASGLNLFQRMGRVVTMANLSQITNVLSPILTSNSGLVLQPTYFPMKLYCQECGSNALQSRVVSPTFSSKTFAEIPYLDVSATADDKKTFLSLAVVNRHETQPITTSIKVSGANLTREARLFEINGASPDAENSAINPHQVMIQQRQIAIAGEEINYDFPPHSVSLLKFALS
jgi:alpha-N-arabinofuranosidase